MTAPAYDHSGRGAVPPPKLRAQLRRRMRVETYGPGESLVRQGEEALQLHFILSGTARIALGRGRDSRIIARLGPGSWIGETALLTGAVSSTTVTAETELRALTISHVDFLAAAEEDPGVFREIARALAHRLRSADDLIAEATAPRIVHLNHAQSDTGRVEQVLAACARWATGSHVALLLDEYGPPGLPLRDHASGDGLSTMRARLAGEGSIAVRVDGATQSELTTFVQAVSSFASLIVLTGARRPASLTHPLDAVVTLGAARNRSAGSADEAAHHFFPTDSSFDPHRVARGVCGQRIGLAFGGGGARGFAHVGVLRELRAAGVPVDAVSGTSIGAAVAAGVADGQRPEDLANSIQAAGRLATVPNPLPVHSMFTNTFIERELRRQFADRHIEDLPTPLAVVAVDVHTGDEVVFTRGEIVPAILASIALPGIFPPVRHDDRVLVDGGVRTPVPIRPCREAGADAVVASRMRVSPDPSRRPARRSLPWMAETISWALDLMQDQIESESVEHADVLIETSIPRARAGLFDFNGRRSTEAAGARAARAALNEIAERVPGVRRDVRRSA